jgi:hypothetical protein
MPKIPELAELERLLGALSKQAYHRCLQRQLDSLYREAEGNCSTVEQLAFTPLEPIRCPGLVSKRPERLEWSSENKLDTQGALARVISKLRNHVEAS